MDIYIVSSVDYRDVVAVFGTRLAAESFINEHQERERQRIHYGKPHRWLPGDYNIQVWKLDDEVSYI